MKHNEKNTKKSNQEKIINFNKPLESTGKEIIEESNSISKNLLDEVNHRKELNELINRVNVLTINSGFSTGNIELLEVHEISDLNESLDSLMQIRFKDAKYSSFPKLSNQDIIISSISGLIAVAIDVLMVGTPDMVKIYPSGKDQLDGSILTRAIRKMGDGPLSGFAEELSKSVKVPYDISINKGGKYPGITPDNHRLKSPAHDPFFGLFFAIFDITFNTFTFVDDTGILRITISDINKKTTLDKFLAMFYYVGHIVSDLFTSRGIPIPGFFMTQFFTSGISDTSFATLAERMYRNGYDLRHLASMNVPKLTREAIIDSYLYLSEEMSSDIALPIADKEKSTILNMLKRDKMRFISNSISVAGNGLKFFSPPYSCNPNSLNAVEWFSFLESSILMLKAKNRDTDAEEVIVNRDEIDKDWMNLLNNSELK